MYTENYTINSCGIYDCDSDWCWNTKGFKDFDLWAVLRGEGQINLDGTSHKIIPGTCFLIPPQTQIHGTHNPNNRILVYSVHFSSKSIPSNVDVKRITDTTFFKELFDRVIRFHNMNRADLTVSCLSILLNEFFSSSDAVDSKKRLENTPRQKCVTEICDKINSSPETEHKLSDLASEYGYSATYLGKMFHSFVGVSFSNYLLNARINHAKLLLINPEMSVAEIAEKLGYYDTSHFINQFKKSVGCTPNTFRCPKSP